MKRHKKAIYQYLKEEAPKLIILYFLLLTFLLITSFLNPSHYEWVNIEWLDYPGIIPRIVISALTYVTLGRYLYKIYFYKLLSIVVGRWMNNWRLYNEIKEGIRCILNLYVFFELIPMIVDFINRLVSIPYNIFAFLVYFLPVIGFPLLVLIIVVLASSSKKD